MMKTVTIALSEPLESALHKKAMHLLNSRQDVIGMQLDFVDSRKLYIQVLNTTDEEAFITEALEIIAKLRKQSNGEEVEAGAIRIHHATPKNSEDISNLLIEEGWVALLKNGDYAYSGKIIRLLDYLDSFLIGLYKHLRIDEWRRYIPMISAYHLEKMGYSEDSPEVMYKLNPIHFHGSGAAALQTAACYKLYFELESKTIPKNMLYSVYGTCFRNEPGRAFLLESSICFGMREFVFIGDKDYVLETREKCLDINMRLLGELGLSGGLYWADDPFFITSAVRKSNSIPNVSKVELRCPIAGRQKDIAVASVNVHGNYFGNTFSIKTSQGGEAWTGCSACGVERLLWAVLQQFGLNTGNWPKDMRSALDNEL